MLSRENFFPKFNLANCLIVVTVVLLCSRLHELVSKPLEDGLRTSSWRLGKTWIWRRRINLDSSIHWSFSAGGQRDRATTMGLGPTIVVVVVVMCGCASIVINAMTLLCTNVGWLRAMGWIRVFRHVNLNQCSNAASYGHSLGGFVLGDESKHGEN